MTPRSPLMRAGTKFAAVAILGLVAFTSHATADTARWTIDWSTPMRAQDAERALDAIERAFSEVLTARPNAKELRTSGDLLITARTAHNGLRTAETNALLSVNEARDRVARDEKALIERRSTVAWASLRGAARQAQLAKEDRYLRTIRQVTRNRETFHRQARQRRERVGNALQAYALSWGELAVERSAGNGIALTRDIWLQHMELQAASFNSYLRSRYSMCAFVGLRPARGLRAAPVRPQPIATPPSAIGTPDAPHASTGRRPVRAQPDPVAPPTQPTPVVRTDPRPSFDNPYPDAGGGHVGPGPAFDQPKPAPVARPPSGKTTTVGGFRWYYSFAEAAAAARAQGKLILALATKPDCTMCEKVKSDRVGPHSARVNRLAVGYIYDIMDVLVHKTASADAKSVNRVVQSSLPPSARTMPLVGFMTADKRWVAGFYGMPNDEEFTAVVDRAARARTR